MHHQVAAIRRLDQFLVRAGVVKRRTLAQKLLKEGQVLGPEGPLKPATLPREGLEFRILRGVWEERFRIVSVDPPRVETLGRSRSEIAPVRRKIDELMDLLEEPFLPCEEEP